MAFPNIFTAPAILAVASLTYAVPACTDVAESSEPVLKDPEELPAQRAINIVSGYLLKEEFDILVALLWPLWNELPDVVSMQVCRPEPDQWTKKLNIHIFLLDGIAGIIGTGTGASFEKAAENLIRNLVHQGYLVSTKKKPLLSIELPTCKDGEEKEKAH